MIKAINENFPEFSEYYVDTEGNIYSNKLSNMKKLKSINLRGYKAVCLYSKTLSRTKMMYIHRLVATCFIPNPNNKPTVNHIDGDKFNNNLNNLQWATHSQNTIHSIYTLDHIKSYYRIPQFEKIKRNNRKRQQYIKKHGVVCIETQQLFKNSMQAATAYKCSKQLISKSLSSGTTAKRSSFCQIQ